MRLFILSTCGTSLLFHALAGDTVRQGILRASANKRRDELSSEEAEAIAVAEARMRERFAAADAATLKRASAELNAILSFLEEDRPDAAGIHHLLISTGTEQGRVSGEWLRDRLIAMGHSAECRLVPDLTTGDAEAFHMALSDVAGTIGPELGSYRDAGYRIVFNLNGGFKSVQGFFQTLAHVYADETIYIFEGASQLMRVPRLPLVLDPDSGVARNFEAMRRLFHQLDAPAADLSAIPGSFLYRIGGALTLSAWGKVAFLSAAESHYGKALLEPLTPAVRYTEGFRKDAAKINPAERASLNRSIEALARYLGRAEDSPNFKDLNFHPIKGSEPAGCTHEFYCFGRQNRRRAYGHLLPGGVFEIRQIGEHLN